MPPQVQTWSASVQPANISETHHHDAAGGCLSAWVPRHSRFPSDVDISLSTAASLLAPTQARQTGDTSNITPDAVLTQLAVGQT